MAESYRPPGIIRKYVTYGGIISPEYIYIYTYMQCYIAYIVKGYHIIKLCHWEILMLLLLLSLLLLLLLLLLFVITSCS